MTSSEFMANLLLLDDLAMNRYWTALSSDRISGSTSANQLGSLGIAGAKQVPEDRCEISGCERVFTCRAVYRDAAQRSLDAHPALTFPFADGENGTDQQLRSVRDRVSFADPSARSLSACAKREGIRPFLQMNTAPIAPLCEVPAPAFLRDVRQG